MGGYVEGAILRSKKRKAEENEGGGEKNENTQRDDLRIQVQTVTRFLWL